MTSEKPDLRERVARAIERADDSHIPEGYYTGSDPNISDWGAFVADAAIRVALEWAATVADEMASAGDMGTDQIAAAIRAGVPK